MLTGPQPHQHSRSQIAFQVKQRQEAGHRLEFFKPIDLMYVVDASQLIEGQT